MKAKAAYILAIIIFFVYLTCGIVIAAGIYSNGFESVAALYAKSGGQIIKGALIVERQYTQIDLKNAGFAADKWGEYSISVTSNPGYDCTYHVNGIQYPYENIDFSDVVMTRKINGGFILKSPGTLEEALTQYYKRPVTIDEREQGNLPFVVTLTAQSGKHIQFLLGLEDEQN